MKRGYTDSHWGKTGSYKRPFDITVLIIVHMVLLPLWLVLWIFIPILIWLGDRGPIFYKQQRAGKDGKAFTMRKFRTMIPSADRQGPAWTLQNDARLTKVGKLLRRTALDELPEIWSILLGDMSLVGPRALDTREQQLLEEQVPGFAERLRVAPGLTGLAQVLDKHDDANVKFRYDLEYIRRMSPWLDFKLLVLSVWNSSTGRWDRREGKTIPLTESDSSRSDISEPDSPRN